MRHEKGQGPGNGGGGVDDAPGTVPPARAKEATPLPPPDPVESLLSPPATPTPRPNTPWDSEERFRLLVDGIQDYAIFMLDETGRIMTWNLGAERLKGYTREEIAGKHFSIFYTPEAIARGWPDEELRIAQERGSLEDEGWRVRKDGSRFWASVIITSMRDQTGVLQGFSKVTRDLSERKRNEEMAQRRTAQLRALAMELARVEQRERRRLAQVLHDHIQQLLVAAKIRLHSINRSIGDAAIARDAQSLDELLGEIIEASRSLSIDISPPIIREAGLARSLKWLADRVRQTQNLEVEVTASLDDEPKSEGIRFLMFDAARELLLNVTKHSGTQVARITLGRTKEGLVSVTVADHGAGFSRQAGEDGGFGLMSLRERAEALGGWMQIASEIGQGAAVILTVPDLPSARDSGESGAGTSVVVEPSPQPEARPIKVLVVDVHYIVRQGLVGLLKGTRDLAVVGEAANGLEAVQKARELKPDVVIMDVNMPVMNGIEATRRLKEELAGDVAVIGLSIYSEDQIARSMREAGAAEYLTKNVPPERLLGAIRSCGRSGS